MNKKLTDYDLLKVIATVLVVFAHITRMYTRQGVITPINSSAILNYVTKYIYSFHMPLFVFISGAIYYYLRQKNGKYNNGKNFIMNKAKRLLIPYVIFGVFYVAPVMVGLNFTNYNVIKYIIKGIVLSMDSRHLWYVFMLFNVFGIFYLIEKYISKIPKYLMVFGLFILYLVSGRLPDILQISTTAMYLLYFYLGYLFEENKKVIVEKLKFNTVTIIVAFILNLITLSLSLKLNTSGFIINTINLCSAMFGIATIYSIVNMILNTNISSNKLYKELKKNSFGIYLFHPMIIYVLFYCLGSKDINPFLLTGIVFIISMILSDLFTRCMRKIKLGIILGE